MFHFNSAAEKKNEGRRSMKAPRIRIEDISAIGEVLSEEQLRGVAGGCCLNGFSSCRSSCNGDVTYDV